MSSSRIANLVMACFAVGVWLGTPTLQYPSFRLLAVAFALIVIALLIRHPLSNLIFLPFASLLLGLWHIQHWRISHYTNFPAELETEAVIVDAPDIRENKTFLTVLTTSAIGSSLKSSSQNGKLLVKVDRFPSYQYGDIVQISGEAELPEAFNGFNYPLFLEKSQIYAIVNRPTITLIHRPQKTSLQGNLYRLRTATEQQMQRFIPEPESSLLAGILLGSKRAIPADIQEALRATGTSHIVAISGANITILLTMLLVILPLYTRRSQFWATVAIGSFISLLTGASASVVRGAFVASLGRWARMHGRPAYPTSLLLAALTGMLIHNPLFLTADPGFQLSFAAFAGLLFLGSPISHFCKHFFLTKPLPELGRAAFAETLAASIGTAPLSFFMFGQLSLLAFIVNPLILWLLPTVSFLGLLFLAIGWIGPLGLLISLPLTILLRFILSGIQWFGSLGFGTIHWQP